MSEFCELEVPPEVTNTRLDRWLADTQTQKSRSQWKTLIEANLLLVNQQAVKARHLLRGGESIRWQEPEAVPEIPQPEDLPLEILYEDESLILLNKAHGMVVHPAEGNAEGTLVNALLHHTGSQLSPIGSPLRPGIVHRLDKDTSGILVVAKTEAAHEHLSQQFSERSLTKLYLAVVQGTPNPPTGTIFTHIARHPVNRQKMAVVDPPQGKPSLTDYRLIAQAEHEQDAKGASSSLILCHLHTGRTHQIRVHLQHLGHPILGDPIYTRASRQSWQGRLLLHAWHLGLTHPVTGQPLSRQAPPPAEFQPWLENLDLAQLLQQATNS